MASNLFSFARSAALSLSALTLGCCCGPEVFGEGDGSSSSMRFAFPRDGDVMNWADDEDGDGANGIQVDPPIRIAYAGQPGELSLSSSQGETATAVVEEDGFARFVGFTLHTPDGGTEVTLVATDGELEDRVDVEAVDGPNERQ